MPLLRSRHSATPLSGTSATTSRLNSIEQSFAAASDIRAVCSVVNAADRQGIDEAE